MARFSNSLGNVLGLNIAKAVSELHGGTIAVAIDGKGKGTKFTMEFGVGLSPQF